MPLGKLRRLIISCRDLGFAQTCLVIKYRIKRVQFVKRTREAALGGRAHHEWQDLQQQFALTLDVLRAQKLSRDGHLYSMIDDEVCVEEINRYVHHQFRVLGSDWYQLDDYMWHTDIRLKLQTGRDYRFDASSYYQDIEIIAGNSFALHKDIKVPWELSRLQHLILLSQAYRRTHNETYAKVFQYQVNHWRRSNPYLLGINWLCPMEVALRAISLVIAFDGFKFSYLSDSFWQEYVALLYDHMAFLEHNWEWYDGRTSNHYLSDLVGYLYLCWFFQSIGCVNKKREWCLKQILEECDKQVFDEGTSYEGSTRYHLLVVELLYHVKLLCSAMCVRLPNSFHQKLELMLDFVGYCSINKTDMITIGDHDGGKVVWTGLPAYVANREHVAPKHFDRFGLSVYKNAQWHVSLRHYAYNKRQPTGHFHNDAGQVTLAIKGIPVLVDPGSYVYTGSVNWRNYFRSSRVHNIMGVVDHEPIPFDSRLFALSMPEEQIFSYEGSSTLLKTGHTLYERLGLIYEREVYITENDIQVVDVCEKSSLAKEDMHLYINFTFSPYISLVKNGGCWEGYYEGQPLFTFVSSLVMHTVDGFVSPTYGVKQKTVFLSAQMLLKGDESYVHQFIVK